MKNTKFQQFDATVRKVLSVSHDELKRREEEWKRQHGRKAGRKPSKKKASSRASESKA